MEYKSVTWKFKARFTHEKELLVSWPYIELRIFKLLLPDLTVVDELKLLKYKRNEDLIRIQEWVIHT